MPIEPKPCPFCGGSLAYYEAQDGKGFVIHPKNGCILSQIDFRLDGWQQRPIEEALAKRVAYPIEDSGLDYLGETWIRWKDHAAALDSVLETNKENKARIKDLETAAQTLREEALGWHYQLEEARKRIRFLEGHISRLLELIDRHGDRIVHAHASVILQARQALHDICLKEGPNE